MKYPEMERVNEGLLIPVRQDDPAKMLAQDGHVLAIGELRIEQEPSYLSLKPSFLSKYHNREQILSSASSVETQNRRWRILELRACSSKESYHYHIVAEEKK